MSGARRPKFGGFPEDRSAVTPVPESFFRDLLPHIDDLDELRVTLISFSRLAHREGRLRYIMKEDFLSHPAWGAASAESLAPALARAVERCTLLEAVVELERGRVPLYFLNTPRGRAAAQGVRAGAWTPSGDPAAPVELPPERPTVFQLYEENIGPLTPLLADSLREAEQTYPAGWIEQAVRIAVDNNVRKWAYIRAILEGWRSRGKDDREDRSDSEKARRRYLKGS